MSWKLTLTRSSESERRNQVDWLKDLRFCDEVVWSTGSERGVGSFRRFSPDGGLVVFDKERGKRKEILPTSVRYVYPASGVLSFRLKKVLVG